MRDVLDRLCRRQDLNAETVEAIFADLVVGNLDSVQLSAFLAALRTKGETAAEIAGAARALVANAKPFPRPDYPFADLVGTGGDGAGTINISTAAALTVAAAGLPIAKHGNRSISSKCGSADVLEALGVRVDPTPDVARRGLDETGFCFFFAPSYHAGLKHAMPVRTALGVRTVMNLLGPLVNPAQPSTLLVGVYDPGILLLVAEALVALGIERGLVVHGSGIDEIALHGPTQAVRIVDGDLAPMTLSPADAGLPSAPLSALEGGGANANARRLKAILSGQGSEVETAAVALNAGALLWTAERASSLAEGTAQAMTVLASGAPLDVVERYAVISHA